MRFDDRLQTLLDAPIADIRDRAVRWRQLVDLLSRIEIGNAGATVDRALDVVRSDAFMIDEQVRAATVRGIAGRRLPPALLRILAAQPVQVAAPIFAGRSMRHDEAAIILAEADAEVRALVAVAPPPAALPPPEPTAPAGVPVLEPAAAAAEQVPEPIAAAAVPAPEPVAPAVELVPEPATEPAPPSISEMVTRIERLKRQRVPSAPSAPSAPPAPRRAARPARGEARLFQWESDASGHIAWVEGAPRGALVGRPLGGDGVGLLERQAASRIGQRHPFIDVPVTLGDTLDGQWTATGVPAFDSGNGRFLGYRGLARRIDGTSPAASGASAAKETDLDALREMVHEIKTPLNAIIGFAEIIDGQYLGPAHRRYRERAAQIVGQARHLLDAVEDLDFAAKLRADRHKGGTGSRLADLFLPIAAELERCMHATGGVLDVDLDGQRHRCALSPELAERLLRRLLLSLCEHVEAGEHFRIAVSRAGTMCVLMIARPRRLEGLAEAQLVDPSFDPREGQDGEAVGLGFALRLVRGLAKVAGGDLVIDSRHFTLQLPALDS